MKRVRFLEPAINEFEEHVAYFDGQVAGPGDRFDADGGEERFTFKTTFPPDEQYLEAFDWSIFKPCAMSTG